MATLERRVLTKKPLTSRPLSGVPTSRESVETAAPPPAVSSAKRVPLKVFKYSMFGDICVGLHSHHVLVRKVNDCYWMPHPSKVYTMVLIKRIDQEKCTVTTLDDSKDLELDVHYPFYPINPSTEADMVALPHLHEAGVLHNLKERSKVNLNNPYTRIANVLVAVNPYREIPDPPYAQFKDAPITANDPHPFGVSEVAYRQMTLPRIDERNQFMIMSGESGAGKSEAAKIAIRYLCWRSDQGYEKALPLTPGGPMSRSSSRRAALTIGQRIIEAGKVLEAFGSAKTSRNDNSSRFGRVTKLFFDDKNGYSLLCASIDTYLLEKSRVVSLAEGERNFHVFYQLLATDDKKKWHLKDASTYNYITQSSETDIDGVNDECNFYQLCTALSSVGITLPDQDSIFRVLSAVLALGNIEFRGDDSSDEDITVVEESYTVTIAAELLGVEREALENILLTRTVTDSVSGEDVSHHTVRLTSIQATSARDTIAKNIYKGLFDWVVKKVGESLNLEAKCDENPFIGVVDMFGFESVELNRLGQLLINFTDESLQMSFNKAIISGEQAIYREQGFDLGDIATVSNALSYNLLVKGPTSIFSVLDDICRDEHPSEEKFSSALHHEHRKNPVFPHPSSRDVRYAFIVKHYTHAVQYTVGNFIPHNKDATIVALKDLLNESTLASSGTLFNSLYQAGGGALVGGRKGSGGATLLRSMGMVKTKLLSRRKSGVDAPKEASDSSANSETTVNPLNKPVAKAPSISSTLVSSYTKAIGQLCSSLESTSCTFIRCLKPNDSKSVGVFESKYVVDQLRSLGIVQTCEVLQLGLPTNVTNEVIDGMYRPHLRPVAGLDSKQFVKAILCSCEPPIPRDTYRVGTSRLFFRTGCLGPLRQLMSMDMTDAKTRKDLSDRVFAYLVKLRWSKIRAIVVVQKLFVYARRRSRAALFLQDRWRYFTISPRYQRKRLCRRRWRIAICRVLFQNKFLKDFNLIVESKALREKNEDAAYEHMQAMDASEKGTDGSGLEGSGVDDVSLKEKQAKSDMEALIYASNLSTITVCLNRWMKIKLFRSFECWKYILKTEGFVSRKKVTGADGSGVESAERGPISLKVLPFNLDIEEDEQTSRVTTNDQGESIISLEEVDQIECYECNGTSQVCWCGSCQQLYCSLCSQLVHGSCRLMKSHKPVPLGKGDVPMIETVAAVKVKERCSIKSCTNEATKGVSTRFCELHYEEFRQQTKSGEKELTLQQQIMILERQLKNAGLNAVQYVDLGEAKSRMDNAVAVLMTDGGSDRDKEKAEKEIEMMEQVMNLNPEYLAEKEEKARQWEAGEKEKNLACVHRMRELIPPDVKSTSQQKMLEEGLPKSIVSRIWAKKALRLICTHKDDIKKLHIAELNDKYTTQGLDIVELRAVFESLPQEFDLDSDGKKANWRNNIREKLLELSNKETGGRLSNVEKRNVAYKGHDHFKLYDPSIPIEATKRAVKSNPFAQSENPADIIHTHIKKPREVLKPICEGLNKISSLNKKIFLSLQPTKQRGRTLLGFDNENDCKAELAARNASEDGSVPDNTPKPVFELKLLVCFQHRFLCFVCLLSYSMLEIL